MRYVVLASVILAGVLGCGTQPSPAPAYVSIPPQQQADVLILSPQGVDPIKDTVGFNSLVKNVAQSFADELGFLFAEKNISYVSVIDQRPELNTGEKMALTGVHFDARSVVMLEIITEIIGSDERLLLRVDYIEIDQIKEAGKLTGVRPTSVISRPYLLRSSTFGDSSKTTLDLAYEFMAFLEAQGKLDGY